MLKAIHSSLKSLKCIIIAGKNPSLLGSLALRITFKLGKNLSANFPVSRFLSGLNENEVWLYLRTYM